MRNALILDVVLFLPVLLGGIATMWFGWVLAGRRGDDDSDGGLVTEHSPALPHHPWPVGPCRSARSDDLARSA